MTRRTTRDPALNTYADWLGAHDMSQSTIDQRLEFANRLLIEWGTLDKPPHFVLGWLKQYGGWTRNTYLGHVRSIYAWMVETGQLEADPTAHARRPPPPRIRPNPIPLDQLAAAIDTADDRLRTWIMLGALAGLRCHEIAKLHADDVTERHITVDGKWDIVDQLPTHPDLWQIARTKDAGYWFPSPQRGRDHVSTSLVGNQIRDHFRTVGITTGSVHRLRHTYCTMLDRAGVRPRVIQQLMRHASLETTMGYSAVDEDERHDGVRRLSLPSLITPEPLAA